MDIYTETCPRWPISNNLSTTALYVRIMENLQIAMGRIREIRAGNMTGWWYNSRMIYVYSQYYKKLWFDDRIFRIHDIYIYIFTNLISTSIHGYQKKRKKTRQEQEIKISRITARGKRKKYYWTKRKKRPTPSHQLKKIKRYAVSWSKEN